MHIIILKINTNISSKVGNCCFCASNVDKTESQRVFAAFPCDCHGAIFCIEISKKAIMEDSMLPQQ